MKTKTLFSLLAAGSLALSTVVFAAGAKTYQVTGPVLEVTDAMIAVQKGKDRWEINRDANTKVTGDLEMNSESKRLTVHLLVSGFQCMKSSA